jgi:putative ABC transport system permease protein
MTELSVRIVAAVIRRFPSPFRERFGPEMMSAFLDQRDALAVRHGASSLVLWRHAARTIAGLVRALVAVRIDQRRQLESIDSHHTHERALMRHLASDARHAARALRSQPAFTIVCIATLALGIGANTAVFNVLDRVILAPLPYDQPEQLVRIYTATRQAPDAHNVSRALDLLEARDNTGAFSSVGIVNMYRETGVDLLSNDGVPNRVRVLPIGADYFATLRATPLLGRTFTRDEERAAARVVILSHELWATFAGGDPSVIGRTIDMSGERYEVVGVMRPTFTDVVAGDVAAWTPQNLQIGGSNNQWNHYLSAVARLKPGVSIARAQAELDGVATRMRQRFPNGPLEERLHAVSLHDDVVGEARSPVYVLMGAAGLVLLIACVNVANLFLARSVSQARDTVIRSALGARQSRLVGLRLTESLLVALAGGVLGSAVAYGGVRLLLTFSPDSLARAEEVQFDWRLFVFASMVTTVTGLVFGAAPAVRATRSNPSDVLREGSRGNTGGRGARHARRFLVASQVSLAVVLLVGTGILIRSFIARQHVSLGFESANVLTFEVHTPVARYATPESRIRVHEQYQQRLRSIPGVARVGATSWLPTNGNYHQWGYEYTDNAGARQSLGPQIRVIDGDYLEALGIPIINGRRFATSDRLDTPDVALISQSLAKHAYGDADPMGRRFVTGDREFQVVGVVGDVANEPTGATAEMVYLNHAQFADDRNWALTYVVKAPGVPDAIASAARRELAQVDRALVVYHPRTLEAVVARHFARDQFTLVLMGVFAAIALSLAAVGVYGVLSYAVSQRTHEIGVRLALGARPGQVRRIILREGVVIGAIGTVIGVAGALALSRVLSSLVFGTSTRDPFVFVAVTLVLGGVVLAASYVPARRATRSDPLDALRRGSSASVR